MEHCCRKQYFNELISTDLEKSRTFRNHYRRTMLVVRREQQQLNFFTRLKKEKADVSISFYQ